MDAEVETLTGAAKGARSALRETHRNGYRERDWDTRADRIDLAIPRLRKGSCFPRFLEPRRTAETALVAVIQGEEDQETVRWTVSPTNDVHGVSSRAVDEPSGPCIARNSPPGCQTASKRGPVAFSVQTVMLRASSSP